MIRVDPLPAIGDDNFDMGINPSEPHLNTPAFQE